jgi:hypothetical protein
LWYNDPILIEIHLLLIMRKIIVLVFSFLAPVAAMAQNVNVGPAYAGNQNVFTLLSTGQSLMNLLIRVLVGFAILVIIWGVIKFIIAGGSGDSEAGKKAKDTILYGVLGLFVITTIWGLVGIVRRTLGTGTPGSDTTVLPCVPGQDQNC